MSEKADLLRELNASLGLGSPKLDIPTDNPNKTFSQMNVQLNMKNRMGIADDLPGTAAHRGDTTTGVAEYDRANAAYETDAELDKSSDYARKRGMNVLYDGYTREEALKDNPFQNVNPAMDGRYGNLNGHTFSDTLKYSRGVDEFNNRRHLAGIDIGHRTLSGGATGTGIDREGSLRWDPIETQETRQMRANESLDKLAREKQVLLQADIDRYKFELRQDIDDICNRLYETTGQNMESFRAKAQSVALKLLYELPTMSQQELRTTLFRELLGDQLKSEKFAVALELFNENPQFAQMWADMFTGSYMPSLNDVAMSNMMQMAYQISEGDPAMFQQIGAVANMTTQLANLKAQFDAFKKGIK